jgi:hypothetical protein
MHDLRRPALREDEVRRKRRLPSLHALGGNGIQNPTAREHVGRGKIMNDLPKPLIAANVDLRDFPFMPLEVGRLWDSELATNTSAEGFRASVLLWCKAWHQVPAGSLPDSDGTLARFAGCDASKWSEIRSEALHGFVKCSDGRLYHPVVCEKATEAWAERERYRKAAQKRWKHKKKTDGAKHEGCTEDASKTHKPRTEDASCDASKTHMQETGTGKGKNISAPTEQRDILTEAREREPANGERSPRALDGGTPPVSPRKLGDILPEDFPGRALVAHATFDGLVIRAPSQMMGAWVEDHAGELRRALGTDELLVSVNGAPATTLGDGGYEATPRPPSADSTVDELCEIPPFLRKTASTGAGDAKGTAA